MMRILFTITFALAQNRNVTKISNKDKDVEIREKLITIC